MLHKKGNVLASTAWHRKICVTRIVPVRRHNYAIIFIAPNIELTFSITVSAKNFLKIFRIVLGARLVVSFAAIKFSLSSSELHGNSNVEVCAKCRGSYLRDYQVSGRPARDHTTGHLCEMPGCGGVLKDNIVVCAFIFSEVFAA